MRRSYAGAGAGGRPIRGSGRSRRFRSDVGVLAARRPALSPVQGARARLPGSPGAAAPCSKTGRGEGHAQARQAGSPAEPSLAGLRLRERASVVAPDVFTVPLNAMANCDRWGNG